MKIASVKICWHQFYLRPMFSHSLCRSRWERLGGRRNENSIRENPFFILPIRVPCFLRYLRFSAVK